MRSSVVGAVVIAGSVILVGPAWAQHVSTVRSRVVGPPAVARGTVMRWQSTGRNTTGAPPAPVSRITTPNQAPSRQPVVYLTSPRAALPPVVWGAAWGWPLGYFGTGPYLMTFFLPDADATAPTRSRALAAEPGELIVADLSEPSVASETSAASADAGAKSAALSAP